MNDKTFKISIILTATLFATGIILFKTNQEAPIQLGVEQVNDGAQHLPAGGSLEYGGDEPPTSGEHGQPVERGVYETEIPDYRIIHNLEHGYVYVSYRPDLSKDAINSIKELFFTPFSNPDFAPSKVIMGPRQENISPIIISSWDRSLKIEKLDEQIMIDYYMSNVNKSPEPGAS